MRQPRSVLFLLSSFLLCAATCAAQAGSLDPTFGDGGLVTTDFLLPGSADLGRGVVAVQADGKLVVAGARYALSQYDFALARYDPAGSLDATFGSGGRVTTDIALASDYAQAIAVQADGKIVAAGQSQTSAGGWDFAVIRYNTDGSLDTSFGGGGKVTTHLGSANDFAYAVAVQGDGKIVAAGYTLMSTGGYDFALVRYTIDGSLDGTFGSGGVVTTHFGYGHDQAVAVAIQADGRIVAGGYAIASAGGYDFAIARYEADGSLDGTFGSGGLVTTPIGPSVDQAYAIAIQADGKIVAAGRSRTASGDYDFALVRYNTDGSVDGMFGPGGSITTDLGSSRDYAYAIAIQDDGTIVAAGYSRTIAGGEDFALARYGSDGSLDASFGSGGAVMTHFGFGGDRAYAVAIQSDQKIVAAGQSQTSVSYDFSLARYNPDGSLDSSFASDGRVTTDIGTPGHDQARGVAIVQADGKIIAAGDNQQGFALARYDESGSLDGSFGNGGRVTTDFGAGQSLNAVAIQPDGKIVAVGTSGAGFALARYNSDGSLDASFDGDGKVTTDFGSNSQAKAVALQADGKIVVTGYAYTTFGADFALARYNSDGSLDASFDGDGMVTTDFFQGYNDYAYAIALQADGRILAAGWTYLRWQTSQNDFALARYNSDGSLDATFGSGGKVMTDFGSHEDYVRAIALQADGRIVAAGNTFNAIAGGWDFTVVRYNTDGNLDPSFDGDGKVTTDFGSSSQANAIALQADGKIVVAGSTNAGFDFALARYHADGSLDAGFDGDGKVTTDFGGDAWANAVTLQADGKLVVAGSTLTPSNDWDFALARYLGLTDPMALLEDLVRDVEDLAATATLNHGQARSLEAKLEAALHQVDRGHYATAVNQLQAFQNEVNALVSATILTPQQGQALYDDAAYIIGVLLL